MSWKCVSKFVIVAGILAVAGTANASSMKTTCSISVSSHGGKRFATMKCSKSISMDGSMVRSQVWEKDNKKSFDRMARLAGRHFTCDMALGNTSRDGDTETTHYDLANCH